MKSLLREQMAGKTVNFYADKSETFFGGQYKILNIKTQGDQNVYLTISSALPNSKSTQFGGLKKYYDDTINAFAENADKFDVSIKCFDLSPGFNDPHNNKKIYNSKLENEVRKNYCTKNKSGVTVPKSDYTMTSNPSDQSLAEGKRVVRLNESDLIRLVKKVLNEQNSGKDVINQDVIECFMVHTKISDLTKIPTCVAIANEIMQTKKPPTDMQKLIKCAYEIASVMDDDPYTSFAKISALVECLVKKANARIPKQY